jgi:hypothetical protein
MALLYYTNTKILFSGAILRTLGNGLIDDLGPFTLGVTVYSGTAPTTAAVVASWATYNSSSPSYLVHFTDMSWAQPGPGALLEMSLPAPTLQTPVNNGTASWAIIWAGQPSPSDLSGTFLPFTNFLIVSVSDELGDGVVRFTSTAFTTSDAISVLTGTMASLI